MKQLLPHQADAVNAVIEEFKSADRTHIVMACGTGKTFTALKIAEAIKPRSVVIFLPSLALISQCMKEWVSETTLSSFTTLSVCGDDTVTNDIGSESLLLEKVSFPVTTEIGAIQRFLKTNSSDTKVIFCTYQSSSVLAQACEKYLFDFSIAANTSSSDIPLVLSLK